MHFRFFLTKAVAYTTIFIVALAVLLFIGSIAYRQLISLKANEELVRHSQDIHITLESLFSTLKDAETGQRGFIITKDSTYLINYLKSWGKIGSSLDSLHQLIADNPQQQKFYEILEGLIRSRLGTLQVSLQLADMPPIVSDTLRNNMQKGQNEMELIRNQINTMIEHELALYNVRKNQYIADIQITPISFLFIILFAIAIFTFSFFKIKRDLKLESHSSRKLENAINDLSFQNTVFTHAEESANSGNFIWNESNGLMKCSNNLLHMLEISRDETPPTTVSLLSMVDPEDKEMVDQYIETILSTRHVERKTVRMISRNGKQKFFRTSGKFLNENGHSLLIGNLQEITADIVLNEQLRMTHSELQKSEFRHYQMISEIEDYAIIFLNENGLIEKWNKGAEKIKGYKEEEIIGKSFSVFYGPEDQRNKLPQSLLEEARTKGRVSHEGWRIRKDGSRFWGLVVITAMHNEIGDVVGFTKITRDLTAQKQSEEDQDLYRRHIERKNAELEKINAELASFNHVASHDLQEPLRKIQTFISRIEEEDFTHLSRMGKEYFTRIHNSANRMQALIDDLITYSHTSRDQQVLVEVDLNDIVGNVLQELNTKLEETKAYVSKVNLPVIQGIPFQLEQLFTNIFDNSLKYRHPEIAPIITISYELTDNVPYRNPDIPVQQKFHKISIADNGIGFDNKYAETIFTLFKRLHGKMEYSGTGIGLAICKKIIENHKGYITASGEVNAGATFYLYFPAMEIL